MLKSSTFPPYAAFTPIMSCTAQAASRRPPEHAGNACPGEKRSVTWISLVYRPAGGRKSLTRSCLNMGPVSGIPPDDSGCGGLCERRVCSAASSLRIYGNRHAEGHRFQAWPLAGHGVAAVSAGKRELYAAGQSGTRTLRQEKGGIAPFRLFQPFPCLIYYFLAVFLSKCAFLRIRKNIQYHFGRAAQTRSQRCHHNRTVNQDRMLKHKID